MPYVVLVPLVILALLLVLLLAVYGAYCALINWRAKGMAMQKNEAIKKSMPALQNKFQKQFGTGDLVGPSFVDRVTVLRSEVIERDTILELGAALALIRNALDMQYQLFSEGGQWRDLPWREKSAWMSIAVRLFYEGGHAVGLEIHELPPLILADDLKYLPKWAPS
jgi:hypothetical protein